MLGQDSFLELWIKNMEKIEDRYHRVTDVFSKGKPLETKFYAQYPETFAYRLFVMRALLNQRSGLTPSYILQKIDPYLYKKYKGNIAKKELSLERRFNNVTDTLYKTNEDGTKTSNIDTKRVITKHYIGSDEQKSATSEFMKDRLKHHKALSQRDKEKIFNMTEGRYDVETDLKENNFLLFFGFFSDNEENFFQALSERSSLPESLGLFNSSSNLIPVFTKYLRYYGGAAKNVLVPDLRNGKKIKEDLISFISPYFESLQYLNISGILIERVFMGEDSLPCLRRLNLRDCQKLTSIDIVRHKDALQRLRYLDLSPSSQPLRSIILRCTNLNDKSLCNISQQRTLRSLSLGYNGMGAEEIKVVVNSCCIQNLTALDFSGNSVGDAVSFIANSDHMQYLTVLALRNNMIDNRGANAIACSKYMNNLAFLGLASNMIGGEGATAAVDILWVSRNLKISLLMAHAAPGPSVTIDLRNNDISTEIANTIKEIARRGGRLCIDDHGMGLALPMKCLV